MLFRWIILCCGLLLLPCLQLGCSAPPVCQDDEKGTVGPLALDPSGSPCNSRCECSNQLYTGFCQREDGQESGTCVSIKRAECGTKGEVKGCKLFPIDVKDKCEYGTQICQDEARGLKTQMWGDCRPIEKPEKENTPELCYDSIDNDCDGKFDKFDPDCESFCQPGSERPCYTGADSTRNRGLCRLGSQTCKSDGKGWGDCKDQVLPKEETCNGRDDDCDGLLDEVAGGCKCDKEGEQAPCYRGSEDTINKGACKTGLRTCQKVGDALYWSQCVRDISPRAEECDGIDNDCNGLIDDDEKCTLCDTPGEQKPCFTGRLSERNRGTCKDGIQICGSDGLWSGCQNQALPEGVDPSTQKTCDPTQPDVQCEESKCDNKDNDCDGQIDETCPGRTCNQDVDCSLIPGTQSYSCIEGRCALPSPASCQPACTGGTLCQDTKCVCPSGLTDCNGTCVYTPSDTEHCGTCGNTCAAGQVCKKGSCACLYNNHTLCKDLCVDFQTSNQHCGSCGNACSTGQTCRAGKCECILPTQKVCNGACIDIQTSNQHCGSCGNACKTGQWCQTGKCECIFPNQTLCGDVCVDMQTSNAHCGSCGNACTGGQVCAKGSCVYQCPAGQTECSGSCVNLKNDRSHCGACGTTCEHLESCVGGICSCPSGFKKCGSICVNQQQDRQHCGGCNTSCRPDQLCNNGTCECPTGFKDCNGACVNTSNNNQHCGKCDNACLLLKVCSASACKCVSGFTDCSGKCSDTQTDPTNCGACGNVCTGGKSCNGGQCKCPTGQTDCNGTCRDTQADPTNCGACGNTCTTGQTCISGSCKCPSNTKDCSGACVDTNTNNTHCGACGNACPSHASCSSGACNCDSGYKMCNGSCILSGLCCTSTDCGGNDCASGQCCQTGESECNGKCANLSTDKQNCGTCGFACAAPQSCNNRRCECPGTLTFCTNACVDMSNNNQNCGVCGTVCTASQQCISGKCQSCPGCPLLFHELSTSPSTASRVISDSKGHLYLMGQFDKTSTFNAKTITPADSGKDIFLIKMDAQHNPLWIKTFGSPSSDEPGYITIDATDQVYISFYYSADILKGMTLTHQTGDISVALVKLDSTTGNVIWAKSFRQTGASMTMAISGMVYDKTAKQIFIAGGFQNGTLSSQNHTQSASDPTGFVLAYDEQGADKSLQLIKASGTTPSATIHAIETDGSGNVYLAGGFTGTLTFKNTITGQGIQDAYIAQYDTTQSQWVWEQVLTEPSENTHIQSIRWHNKSLYVTGGFGRKLTIGTNTISSSFGALFIAKIDDRGTTWAWSQQYGGTSLDFPGPITIDTQGDVYTAGYTDSADFTIGTYTIGTNYSGLIGFLAKYNGSTGSYVTHTYFDSSVSHSDIPTSLWFANDMLHMTSTGNMGVGFGTQLTSSTGSDTKSFFIPGGTIGYLVSFPVLCNGTDVVCGGQCVDIQNDTNHCGACNNQCTTTCMSGTCVP